MAQAGMLKQAAEEAKKAIDLAADLPQVKARAVCLLGDIAASGDKPDYRQANRYHTEAAQLARPFASSKRPAIRVAAKEVLLDAYSEVTKVPEKFAGYPAGTRALQLPDSAVGSYFLSAFGRPVRAQTRESERTSVPTVTPALHIFNGDTLNNKLRAPGSSISMLLKLGFTDDQIVDYLYLASFSRPPTEKERTALVDGLQKAEQQIGPEADETHRAALNDLAWAMLTSEEFVFNH